MDNKDTKGGFPAHVCTCEPEPDVPVSTEPDAEKASVTK